MLRGECGAFAPRLSTRSLLAHPISQSAMRLPFHLSEPSNFIELASRSIAANAERFQSGNAAAANFGVGISWNHCYEDSLLSLTNKANCVQ
jgi:hypothetical protein